MPINSNNIISTIDPQSTSYTHTNINQINLNDNKTIKILYMNARSISNKQEELQYILETLKTKIHIISITETWINKGEDIYFSFNEYVPLLACRPTKKGGGAALLIQKNIKYETIFNYSNDDDSIISTKIEIYGKTYIIINVYRAPSKIQNKIIDFLNKINTHLSEINNTSTIITGDFNFNVRDMDDNTVQSYLTMMRSNNMHICDTNTITRDLSQTSLDHIHTNIFDQNIDLHYVPYDMLDHRLIVIEIINNNNINIQQTTTPPYTRKKINHEQLKINLQNTNFIINTTQTTNEIYDSFILQLQQNIEKCTKHFQIKENKFNAKPWYNNELRQLFKIKNYWYRKKTKNPTNQQVLSEYIISRNKLTTALRKNKSQFFKNDFTINANNNKKTWETIKKTLYNGNIPNKKNTITLLPNPADFIHELNDFIANVGTNLQNNFNQQYVYYMPNQTNAIFNIEPCSIETIKKTIMSLKNTKSVGHDELSTEILKNNIEKLSPYIQIIVNSSIHTSTFPEQLKLTKITPILKSGKPDQPTNYRPICIVPVIDKIIEKIVNSELLEYLETNNILNNKQYGFRNKSNTNTALFDFISLIQNNLDKRKKVGAIFIDKKKAFETVDRNILLKKMNAYGIKGKEYKWFESYFKNRKQFTQVNELKSTNKDIHTGVAQGTNLAATLFIIYINDIQKIQLKGEMFLYADDIAIVYNADNIADIENQMNEDCQTIKTWMDKNKLTINTEKTKYIIFKIPDSTVTTIKYNNDIIERVHDTKYLGVSIDQKLNWKIHIKNIKSKTSAIAGIFRRIAPYVPHHVKKQIFYSLFHSKLTYGLLVWYHTFKTNLVELQTLQNKAIRNLFQYDSRQHINEMHSNEKIPTLNQFADYTLLTHIHNIDNKFILSNTNTTRRNQIHTHNTRTSSHLATNLSTTTRHGLLQPLRKGILLYNGLQENIKNLNQNLFKNKIKEIIYHH